MLEIPESITIVRQLNETIKGKVIRYAIANQSEHKFAWYHEDPKAYSELLENQVVGESYAYAGLIEIHVSEKIKSNFLTSYSDSIESKLAICRGVNDKRIVFGDGATLRYFEDCTKAPKKNQLYLEFEDNSAITVTIQMYGGIWAFRAGEFDNSYYLGAMSKPSVFSKEFTYDYFKALYTDDLKKSSVKAFLATQQRIPGLGNGVLQDILYEAHLHPKRKMNTISEDELHNLYSVIIQVLEKMVEQGGRDTEKDLYGNNGAYITYLSKKTYLTHVQSVDMRFTKKVIWVEPSTFAIIVSL